MPTGLMVKILKIVTPPPGLHKASILCILDTRQIDPRNTASIQKIGKSSWAEGPVCNKLDTRQRTHDIRH